MPMIKYLLQDRDGRIARVLVKVSDTTMRSGDADPQSPLYLIRGLPLSLVYSTYRIYNLTDSEWVKNRDEERSMSAPLDVWLKTLGIESVEQVPFADHVVRKRPELGDLLVGFHLEPKDGHPGFHLGRSLIEGITEIRREHV